MMSPKTNPMDAALPAYDPPSGFWRPRGRRAHKAVRDTAETMMEVQEYKPPRTQRVHPENLPAGQWNRERAYREGQEAHRRGEARDSSGYHAIPRFKRSVSEDAALAAFELGWDTAAQASQRKRGTS
jgi:hypothetical protein